MFSTIYRLLSLRFAISGLDYEMSTLIPPQFDRYGTTFWIPSQVEPSVAIIGTSLPTLRAALDIFFKRIGSTLSSSKRSNQQTESELSGRNSTKTPERRLLSSREATGEYIELQEHPQGS